MPWMLVSDLPLKAATVTTPATRYLDSAALTALLDQFQNWRDDVNGGGKSLSNVVINTSLAASVGALTATTGVFSGAVVFGGQVDASGNNLINVASLSAASGLFTGAISAASAAISGPATIGGTLSSSGATITGSGAGTFSVTTLIVNNNASAAVTAGILRVSSANDSASNVLMIALSTAGPRFYVDSSGIVAVTGSAWNAGHFIMGSYHFWVDSSARLRIKNGSPVSDVDGTVVGTQS